MDLMEVMKENKIIMPHGLTMLARGLTHMEGVLADIAPEINIIEIASRHMAGRYLLGRNWKKELKNSGKTIFRSIHKALEYSRARVGYAARVYERTGEGESGSSRLGRTGAASSEADPQYCYGTLGHGTADQLQYHLYHGYEAKDHGNPGPLELSGI